MSLIEKRRLLIAMVCLGLMAAPTAHSAPSATLTIYTDALDGGWANWSWDTTMNFDNTAPVHAGNRSIARANCTTRADRSVIGLPGSCWGAGSVFAPVVISS